MSKLNMGSKSSGWRTALDVDFTAQPTQTLAPDGDYVIGGYTFTKINSANEVANMVLTNGVGVVIQPNQASTYTGASTTLPALTIPLSSIMEFDTTTTLRLSLYIASDNMSADFHFVALALNNPVIVTSEILFKMWWTSAQRLSRVIAGGVGISDLTQAWPVGHNALLLYHYSQLGKLMCTGTYAGGAWPPYAAWDPSATRSAATTSLSDSQTGLPANYRVLIGAGRAGAVAAFTATLGRLRIECDTMN